MKKSTAAIFALILANIIWGAAAPIFKWSLVNIHPMSLAFMRFFLASLIFFPFAKKQLKIERRDFIKLTAASVIGMSLSIPIYFYGLQLSKSINSPIISSSGPIFTIIGAMLFLGEHPKKKIILGTIISLVGVLIIVLQPILKDGFDGSVTGNILFVASTIGSVIYTLLIKELAPKYKAATLNFWIFAVAAVSLLPFVLVESHTYGFLTNLDARGLGGIYFGALLSSALAYFLYSLSLKKLSANEVGLFTYIEPIAAIVIAIPLLGEKVTFPFLLGSLFVFAGIILSEAHVRWHAYHLHRRH